MKYAQKLTLAPCAGDVALIVGLPSGEQVALAMSPVEALAFADKMGELAREAIAEGADRVVKSLEAANDAHAGALTVIDGGLSDARVSECVDV